MLNAAPAASGRRASSAAMVIEGHGCSISGATRPGCRRVSGAADVP